MSQSFKQDMKSGKITALVPFFFLFFYRCHNKKKPLPFKQLNKLAIRLQIFIPIYINFIITRVKLWGDKISS